VMFNDFSMSEDKLAQQLTDSHNWRSTCQATKYSSAPSCSP